MCTTQILFLKSLTASHTKCMFSMKCNSCRIAIQWFHVSRYSGIPYTKIQPYFMLAGIQAFHIQKFSCISLGCNLLCFCMILNFGSPTKWLSWYRLTETADHVLSNHVWWSYYHAIKVICYIRVNDFYWGTRVSDNFLINVTCWTYMYQHQRVIKRFLCNGTECLLL